MSINQHCILIYHSLWTPALLSWAGQEETNRLLKGALRVFRHNSRLFGIFRGGAVDSSGTPLVRSLSYCSVPRSSSNLLDLRHICLSLPVGSGWFHLDCIRLAAPYFWRHQPAAPFVTRGLLITSLYTPPPVCLTVFIFKFSVQTKLCVVNDQWRLHLHGVQSLYHFLSYLEIYKR